MSFHENVQRQTDPRTTGTHPSGSEESSNQAVFRRIIDAVNAHDDEAMSQTFDDVIDSGVMIHNPVPTDKTGAEAMKAVFVGLHRGFPDLRVEIDDLLEDGEKVVARQTVTGTNLGEFMNRPPTGRHVRYEEIFIFRFACGRVVEIWGVVDVLTQLRQLGATQA